MPSWYGFSEYVPVGVRRARGQQALRRILRDERRVPAPVVIAGRKIARTFWGRAWCENLERYGDFASRLPRGRNYARNGSVLDLQIGPGAVRAFVAGSELYTVDVTITPLRAKRWRSVITACGARIDSLVGLLRGELPDDVLALLTDGTRGLFPDPAEIRLRCSCPDAAVMCKHVAATLYGIGARLDTQPDLFFTLRKVDQAALVEGASSATAITRTTTRGRARTRVAVDALESIFGIEIVEEEAAAKRNQRRRSRGAGSEKGTRNAPKGTRRD